MKKIKIGQIGISHEHAHGKITTLKNMPDVYEIVGVVDDRKTSKGATFLPSNYLESYDGLKFMTENELFSIPDLQAVTIETPNVDLVPTALRCMERNLAMHMDKPGGENLALFGKLRKGCEDKNIPFQMGYMFRGNPAIQFCMRIIREKWLGEIYEIQASMSHNYGDDSYNDYLSTFKGGIMFNLGCHAIDYIVSMMGRPNNISPFLKSIPGIPSIIKNNCLVIFEYSNSTVTLRASSIELNAEKQGGRPLKICGTKGTLYLCPIECFNGQALQLHLSLREDTLDYAAGAHVIEFEPQGDRYKNQLLELAKIINGEINNPYTYKHDYLVQEVILAASGYSSWNNSNVCMNLDEILVLL